MKLEGHADTIMKLVKHLNREYFDADSIREGLVGNVRIGNNLVDIKINNNLEAE